MQKQTEVLIIGGGFAGVAVAQQLSKSGLSVTLIDQKDYFEVTFAMLRNVADPTLLGDTPRKYYRDFIDGTFMQAKVESMTDNEVRLDSGASIGFNYAIIASGSRYPTLPLAKSHYAMNYTERREEIHSYHRELAQAKSVLILGGGTVGVELAGEIASAFTDKHITLANSSGTLLDHLSVKAQQNAQQQLSKKGVEVKLNRRFIKDGTHYYCNQSDESITADVVYECIGMRPNTAFLQPHLSHVLNEQGLIKVDPFMKVVGFEHLYALGDCAALDTHKHGYLASVQGGMLAKAIIKAKNGKAVKPYKTPPLAVITVTGTDSGIASMPFGTTTLNFLVNLKQKDLGIKNMYKMYGSEPDALQRQ